MLERREAELREAMKLRHGLTSLLHSLRTAMEQVTKPGAAWRGLNSSIGNYSGLALKLIQNLIQIQLRS